MSNWTLTLARNGLEMTQEAVESFLSQQIDDPRVVLFDHCSNDGTGPWARHLFPKVLYYQASPQDSVASMWNRGLELLFDLEKAEAVLVANNDVVLRPDTYKWLLEDGGGFVTGVGSDDPGCVAPIVGGSYTDYPDTMGAPQGFHYPSPDPTAKRPHPDFSCFLIRKWVWNVVGPFDESFKTAFGEDCDYHVRMHRNGIDAWCLDLPFYHKGSGTLDVLDDEEVKRIGEQADRNREYFKRKWGFAIGSKEYEEFFQCVATWPSTSQGS